MASGGDTYSTVSLINTVLVSQTTGISVTVGNTATIDSILFFKKANNTGGGGSVTAVNVITGTPAFAADGYHLTNSSVAIDKGVQTSITTDIDGQARSLGSGPDLGPDEFSATVERRYLPLIVR